MQTYRPRSVSCTIKYNPVNLINITSYLTYKKNIDYTPNTDNVITLYVHTISQVEKPIWEKCDNVGIPKLSYSDYLPWINSMNDTHYNSYKQFIELGKLPSVLSNTYNEINIPDYIVILVLKKINKRYLLNKYKNMLKF